MVVAMAVFTANDAITKLASESMNIGQIILVRGLFASVLIGAIAWQQGALRSLRSALHPLILWRTLGEAGGTVTYLIALSHIPLANVSAVQQALPLAVTIGAALFFGEGVGWRRWLSIAAGFTGVMIIVRPGFEGFSAYSLLVLGCVIFCTVRDLVTRQIAEDVPTLLISTVTAVAITLLGAVLAAPMGGWAPMAPRETGLLALAAVLLFIGYQFIIKAMRVGDVSFIAPFRYTALLWAILLGVIIFGDFPDIPTVAGSIVIVCSGIYMLYRERTVGKHNTAAESTGPAMAPDGI
jgi:drug/metabolite transporter (DMT)-like permease